VNKDIYSLMNAGQSKILINKLHNTSQTGFLSLDMFTNFT